MLTLFLPLFIYRALLWYMEPAAEAEVTAVETTETPLVFAQS
jgi:hypothetical protein